MQTYTLAIILSVLSCFMACTDSATTIIKTDLGTYHQVSATHRDYTINLPIDWKIKEHSKSGTLQAVEVGSKDKFNERIVILPMKGRVTRNQETGKMEAAKVDLTRFSKRHINNLGNQYADFKAIEIGETTLNGQRAKRCIYNYTDKNEEQDQVKVLSYILTKDYEAYIINCVAKADHFKRMKPIFEEICKSFRFVAPKQE